MKISKTEIKYYQIEENGIGISRRIIYDNLQDVIDYMRMKKGRQGAKDFIEQNKNIKIYEITELKLEK